MNDAFPCGIGDWAALQGAHDGPRGLLRADMVFSDVVAACKGGLAYLATPYSREVLRNGRWSALLSDVKAWEAARWAAWFAVNGVTALSPIAQAVAMINANAGSDSLDPLDAKFWNAWCRPMLRNCDAVIVPPIDGWDRSQGVWMETAWALGRNRRVFLVRPEDAAGVLQ